MDLASSVCNLQAATSVLPKSARYSVVSPLESTIGTGALPSSRHAQVLQQDFLRAACLSPIFTEIRRSPPGVTLSSALTMAPNVACAGHVWKGIASTYRNPAGPRRLNNQRWERAGAERVAGTKEWLVLQ